MIRTLVLAAVLSAASGSALAHGDYSSGYSVSIGSPYYGGYALQYRHADRDYRYYRPYARYDYGYGYCGSYRHHGDRPHDRHAYRPHGYDHY